MREKAKKVAKEYKETVIMNVLRVRLFAAYKGANFTYGNITAADRNKLFLKKTHANDAVAIAAHLNDSIIDIGETTYYRQYRKKKRSLHEANPRKGKKVPNRKAERNKKNSKVSADGSIRLGDKVIFNDTFYWVNGFTGYDKQAYLKTGCGNYYTNGNKPAGVSVSKLKFVHHTKGWVQYAS